MRQYFTDKALLIFGLICIWLHMPIDVKASYPDFEDVYVGEEPSVRYLVITADSLRDSFRDFAMGKALKGYDVYVKAVEDIYSDYSMYPDTVERIKRYIYDCYNMTYTERFYVLLAGNTEIVPTRYCDPKSVPRSGYSVTWNLTPSDFYYACFSGQFDWDRNRNGVYAELNDSIVISLTNYYRVSKTVDSDGAELIPEILIGRIPVSNSRDIRQYIDKLDRYERPQQPHPTFYNSTLFAGTKLYYNKGAKSDANYFGDSICNNFIAGNMSVSKLYDTYSSFPGKHFVASDIHDVLNNNSVGFNIMNIFTHGDIEGWQTEDGALYNINDAAMNDYAGAAIITSGACNAGNFTEDCLANSIILNPNNNSIAHWGSTANGWYHNIDTVPGASAKFLGYFYNRLFNDDDKTLGKIIQNAYFDALNDYDQYLYSTMRYLYLAHNLIGDADIKIMMSQPSRIQPFDMTLNENQAILNQFEEEGTLFNIVFQEDNGMEMGYDNIQPQSFVDVNSFIYDSKFELGIYKEGYMPFRSDKDFYRNITIQKTALDKENIRAQNVTLGSNLVSDLPNGKNRIKANSSASFEIHGSFTIEDSFECPLGATLNINTINR